MHAATMISSADSAATPARLSERGHDQLLVERGQRGDMRAFESLVEKYAGKIYALVYHMTGHREDAHDISQETFARAYRGLAKFRGESGFYSWVYSIATNLTLTFLKKRRRRGHYSLEDLNAGQLREDAEFQELVSWSDPVREAGLNELQQAINDAMQQLSPPHRMVVTLFDIQGLAHGEIAQLMKVSEGTVRSRLHYAHKQLQGLLAGYLQS